MNKVDRNYRIKFWRKHLDWFIPFVSELYPLTKFQLLQYEDVLDWDRIAINQFINWDCASKQVFEDKLISVDELKETNLLVDSDDEVVTFMSYWYVGDEGVYLRETERTENQVYWKDINFGFYKKVDYKEEALLLLIEHFDCQININQDLLSDLPVPTQIIKNNEDEMEYSDWKMLSKYWGLKWSFELLHQFEKYWVGESLILNHTAFNYCLKNDLDDDFIAAVLC